MILLRGCFSSRRIRDKNNRLLISVANSRFMSQSRSKYYVCHSTSTSRVQNIRSISQHG